MQIHCPHHKNKILPSDLVRDFLGVLIAIKEYELQYDGYEKKPTGPEFYYEALKNCDTTLFEALNDELNAWISEEDNYSNVDFYNRINLALEISYNHSRCTFYIV